MGATTRLERKLDSIVIKVFPRKYYPQLVNLYLSFRGLTYLLYIGSKYECPFCGAHLRKFLPEGKDIPLDKEEVEKEKKFTGIGYHLEKELKVIGAGYNLNSRCPHCHSFNRERHVYLYLKNKTNIFHENIKMLHVAPEINLQRSLKSSPNIEYISADLHSALAMIKMDLTNIEYDDNSFDVIICNHTLEHIPDDRKAMAELYRVLKPGGWAILQVPISPLLDNTYECLAVTTPEGGAKILSGGGHVRIYGKDYRDRLEKAGYSVETYSFTEEFGESISSKYGLIKDENIYICSKHQ